MKIKKVAVIGAGTIGVSVTVDLISHGIAVVLVDISEQHLEKARSELYRGIQFGMLFIKSMSKVPIQDRMDKVTFTTNLEDVNTCDFIIENVTEDWETKRRLYKQLDSICKPNICFGANTSCLSITKIASVTDRQDKLIGVHFMNPVVRISCVEVIRGTHTSDDTINVLQSLLDQLEKRSIVVNDYPGFVSNRISHLFINEAAFVTQDQVATPEQIDLIFKQCYGHKMGPLETADLIGLDTVVNSLEVLYQSYGDPKFRCCPLLKKMVDAGYLGRKTERGFYEYPKN